MTPTEQDRLREGMKPRMKDFTTPEWRFYFSFLLGRDVTTAETDAFLRDEIEQKERVA